MSQKKPPYSNLREKILQRVGCTGHPGFSFSENSDLNKEEYGIRLPDPQTKIWGTVCLSIRLTADRQINNRRVSCKFFLLYF